MSTAFRSILCLVLLSFACWNPAFPNENTFHNQPAECGLGIPIPEDNCTVGLSHPLVVSGQGNILGSNSELSEIRLIIDHIWEFDLRIALVSPSGTRVRLSFENSTSATTYSYGNPAAPDCEEFTSFTMDPCKAEYIISDKFILNNFVGTFFPEGDFADFDGEDPNGTWYLEICDKISGSNSGSLEFAEILFNPLYCDAPTNVSVTAVYSSGFNLSYTPSKPGALTIIEIVEEGKRPGNGSTSPSGGYIGNSNSGFFNLLGPLSEATCYDIYVREQCSNGNFSKNTCATKILTDCQVSAPTIYENFDNQALCEGTCGEICNLFGFWSNAGNDDFDWLVYQGPTESNRTGPSSDYSGFGRYIYIEATGNECRESAVASLESNCVFVTNNSNNCHLSFMYHMYGFGIGTLKLQVQGQASDSWIDLWSESGDQGDIWNKQFIDLTNYANTFVKFRFISTDANNTTGDIALDDITFFGPYDNGPPSILYYEDLDQDGFGDAAKNILSCSVSPPQGYVSNNIDCNDSNPNIFPGSSEITCNGEDDNCNGMADDSFIASPVVYNQNICSNKSTPINASSTPVGELYWYSDQLGSQLLGIGDELSTELNPGSQTLYVKDSISHGPGLRITEIELNDQYHIELQSIGVAGDYTGWKVLVNSLVAGPDINDMIASVWEQSYMKRDQVVTRSRNEWIQGVIWGPDHTGWAMLLDPQGNAIDILFWNWSEEELANFDITYEGQNYNINNVPWWGPAVDASSCKQTALQLTGDNERNFHEDYICTNSNIGLANTGLNMTTHCSSQIVPFTVSVFQAPIVTIDLDVNPCEASSITSAIDLTIVSGIGPYSYLWSNGSDLEDQTDLSPGTYSVTVTSVNGCQTILDEISIGQNSATLSVQIEEKTDVSCNGLEDGKAIIKVFGGPAPYQFNWSVGIERDLMSDTDTLEFLSEGIYEVTVTDNNGCTSNMSFQIEEPEEISVSVNIEKPSCQNTNDGSIVVNSIGGTAPLAYTWYDNSNTNEVNSLNPGSYALTIEDANGCLLILDPIKLETEQDTIAVENIMTEHISCNGANTGQIVVEVVGGDKPLSFIWNNGEESSSQNELPAGNYELTITDDQGCSITISDIILFEPNTAIALEFNTINTACLGNCNGVAVAEALGGIPPYNYTWDNGATTETVENLCSGFIGLTIEDFAGCEYISQNQILVENDATNFVVDVEVGSVRCHGEANGSIDLEVSGGVKPYTFDWDIAPDIQSPQGLIAGNFNCTIYDAAGCEFHLEEVNIGTPDPIEISLISALGSVTGMHEGSLEVTVTGGTDPYTINWYNEMGGWIGYGTKMDDLNPGTYRIQMIDFNTCNASLEDLVVPLLTSSDNIVEVAGISLFPNPVNSILNFKLSNVESKNNLQIQIVDILGQTVKSQAVSPQQQGQVDTESLTAGYYIFNLIRNGNVVGTKAFVKG